MKDYCVSLTVDAEECDCGGKIRHLNGGNYHAITEAWLFTHDKHFCVVREETSTREAFPGDRYDWLVFRGGKFQLIPEEDPNQFAPDDALGSFRYAEGTIICQE